MTAAGVDRVRAEFPGRTIDYFPSIDSTMHAAVGRQTGYVVIAGEQTAGQGRHGHTWHSEAGSGLYFSMVLPPAPVLTLALGLATADAITQVTGVACDLRWPNDVMIGEKKVSGILTQLSGALAIAGIGINLRQTAFPPQLSNIATSLKMHTGRDVDAADLLTALLQEVERYIAESTEDILRLFTQASSFAVGRRVRVEQPDGVVIGTTAGLDSSGFLIVRKDDGTDTLIVAGGVRAFSA
jgi:BirA family transcriptional regulator, biotin operon repressor / biotin---[acetyl-CoA-carboxylase] ligase